MSSIHNKSIRLAFDKGYRADDDGNIISHRGLKLSLYKKPKRGLFYYSFGIRGPGRIRYTVDVHRFIGYQNFGEDALKDGIQTRHSDGNSLNNSRDNIKIGTPSDNMMDKLPEDRMTQAITASTTIRKFSDEVMEEIRQRRREGWTYRELMDEYNISSKGTMSHIINNKYVTKV